MKTSSWNSISLYICVFFAGAVVMVYELIGSRILAPYLGTSIYIWTAIIGVILGSLSIGYTLGGKIADKNPSRKTLSAIFLLAAIFIAMNIPLKNVILAWISIKIIDIRFGAVLASLLLFTPGSVILGMVSPYAVKLKLEGFGNSGTTVGRLFAISTIGSIFGTFVAGFWLIPLFGSTSTVFLLSIFLVFCSIILYPASGIPLKTAVICILVFLGLSVESIYGSNRTNNVKRTETIYNHVTIYDTIDRQSGESIRVLGLNNEKSSATYLEKDGLVFRYTRYYRLFRHFNPEANKTLMIGGGAFSWPQQFVRENPGATIDVVEIDPDLSQLAKTYFGLQENDRITTIPEDGRVFLNRTQEKYDAIFGDAFSAKYSLPYQLTTVEAIRKKYDALNRDGVVIVNIISAINGEKGKFLRAEYATYREVFPHVLIIPTVNDPGFMNVQNLILVALKSSRQPLQSSADAELNEYLALTYRQDIPQDLPVLTDDYAPVEYYAKPLITE